MPCITDITASDKAQHFEVLLCKACKFLTVEQIKNLTNPNSGICDGLDWYSSHLWLDCKHNDNIFSFNEPNEREIEIAKKELKRIGFKIVSCNEGTQLVGVEE